MTIEQILPWVLLLSLVGFTAWLVFRPSARSRKTDFRVIAASAVLVLMTGGFIFWQSGFRTEGPILQDDPFACLRAGSPMATATCLASQQEGMDFYLFGTNSEVQPALADFANSDVLGASSVNLLTPNGFDKANPSAPFVFLHHDQSQIADLKTAVRTGDYESAWSRPGWLKLLGDFAEEWANPRDYPQAVMESFWCGETPDGQPCSDSAGEEGFTGPSGRCEIMPPGSFSCPMEICEFPPNCNGGALQDSTNACATVAPPGGGDPGSGGASGSGDGESSGNGDSSGDGAGSQPEQGPSETMAIAFFDFAPVERIPELLGVVYVDSTNWVQAWNAGTRGIRGVCVSDRPSEGVLRGAVLTEDVANPCEQDGDGSDFVPMSVFMAGVSGSMSFNFGRLVGGVGLRLGSRFIPVVGAAVTVWRVSVTGIRLGARYLMRPISRGLGRLCSWQAVAALGLAAFVFVSNEVLGVGMWWLLKKMGVVDSDGPSEICRSAIKACYDQNPIPQISQVRLGGNQSSDDEMFLKWRECNELTECIENVCNFGGDCSGNPGELTDIEQPSPGISPDQTYCDQEIDRAQKRCQIFKYFELPTGDGNGNSMPLKKFKKTASCIQHSNTFDSSEVRCALLSFCPEGTGLDTAQADACVGLSPEYYLEGTVVDWIKAGNIWNKLWRARPQGSP